MNRWREARRELRAIQIEDLNDYQRGVVVLAGLGCGLVTFVTDAALVVVATRAIRRGWRQRQLGPARAVAGGLAPASGWAAGLIGAQVAGAAAAVWVVNRQLAGHAVAPRWPGPRGVPDPPAPG